MHAAWWRAAGWQGRERYRTRPQQASSVHIAPRFPAAAIIGPRDAKKKSERKGRARKFPALRRPLRRALGGAFQLCVLVSLRAPLSTCSHTDGAKLGDARRGAPAPEATRLPQRRSTHTVAHCSLRRHLLSKPDGRAL